MLEQGPEPLAMLIHKMGDGRCKEGAGISAKARFLRGPRSPIQSSSQKRVVFPLPKSQAMFAAASGQILARLRQVWEAERVLKV